MVLPPLLDARFAPRRARLRPHREPLVLVHGIYQAAVKRVAPALRAVEALHAVMPVRLCRISSLPRSPDEVVRGPRDEFLTHLLPAEVAAITARADLTLFTSEAGEGFGLPVLESIAAGVPVVAVRIPSLAVFEHMGVIETVDAPDPQRLAAAMRAMLAPPAWRGARRRGLRFARLWRAHQDRRAAGIFRRLALAHWPPL